MRYDPRAERTYYTTTKVNKDGKAGTCDASVIDKPKVFVQMDGREFHQQCVRCSRCQNQILEHYMMKKPGELLCTQCGMSKCAKCNQSINSMAEVQAQGKSFHLECFSCVKCRIMLEGKYYGDATAPKCASCELPRCSFCMNTIPSGTRYDILPETNQVMCPSCRSANVVQGKVVAGPRHTPAASVPQAAPSIPVTIVVDQPVTCSVQTVTVPGQQRTPTYDVKQQHTPNGPPSPVPHHNVQVVHHPVPPQPSVHPYYGPSPPSPSRRLHPSTQHVITVPMQHPTHTSTTAVLGGGRPCVVTTVPVQLPPPHANVDVSYGNHVSGKTYVSPPGAMPPFYGA